MKITIEVQPSDMLKIHDALGKADIFFRRRDEMNAAIHLSLDTVRWSPITSTVSAAYDRFVQILEDAGILPEGA